MILRAIEAKHLRQYGYTWGGSDIAQEVLGSEILRAPLAAKGNMAGKSM